MSTIKIVAVVVVVVVDALNMAESVSAKLDRIMEHLETLSY